MGDSAVAERNETGTALDVVLDEPIAKELERLRQGGAALVEKKRIVNEVTKVVAGLTWGNVSGVQMSPQMRYSIAEFCYVTGANPHVHLDILGNKPYLNVQYWQDLLNADPHYLGYEQINISKGVSEEFRRLAAEARKEAEALLKEAADLEMPELREDAIRARRRAASLMNQAFRVDEMRIAFEVPAEVSASYVTIIRRHRAGAPLDDITRGIVDGASWIVEIAECNHAGKADDPVGKKNPGTTARSRSFRRAAVKGFSAWLARRDQEIERAEKMIEANFRVLNASGQQEEGFASITTGNGEPTSGRAALPQGIPVRGEEDNADPTPATGTDLGEGNTTSTEEPEERPIGDAPLSDAEAADMLKRYMATLRDAGLSERRKEWQEENKLPSSTKEFTRADWYRALGILEAPTRDALVDQAGCLGFDSVDEYIQKNSINNPSTLRDMKALLVRMQGDE